MPSICNSDVSDSVWSFLHLCVQLHNWKTPHSVSYGTDTKATPGITVTAITNVGFVFRQLIHATIDPLLLCGSKVSSELSLHQSKCFVRESCPTMVSSIPGTCFWENCWSDVFVDNKNFSLPFSFPFTILQSFHDPSERAATLFLP